MTTVAAFYTAQSLLAPCAKAFSELLPDVRLINVVDDGFISDVIRNGGMSVGLGRRLLHYFEGAEAAGADFIFSTCSSIGDFIEGARGFVGVPIVRIDGAMAAEAVSRAERVAVLATLSTTLGPTVRLVRRHSEQIDKRVDVVEGLADGAFAALQAGDTETHNRLILETAMRLKDRADLFLLAQGSMSPMEQPVAQGTGKPVLTSLRSGVRYLKDVITNGADPRN